MAHFTTRLTPKYYAVGGRAARETVQTDQTQL